MRNSRSIVLAIALLAGWIVVVTGWLLKDRIVEASSISNGGGGGFPQTVVVTAMDTTTTLIFSTPTDVTGAALALAANKRYRFEWYVRFQSDLGSVGVGIMASVPAGATIVGQTFIVASTISNHQQGWVTASGTLAPGASPAVAAVDTTYPAYFTGIVETGGDRRESTATVRI